MLEIQWNKMSHDLWDKVFRENFTCKELANISTTCKKWLGHIRGKNVGMHFLMSVGVNYDPNMLWMATYNHRPNVIIAVDISHSMMRDSKLDRAKVKAKKIFTSFLGLAEKGGVTLLFFGTEIRSVVVRTREELETRLADPDLLVQNRIGEWKIFFDKLKGMHSGKTELRSEVCVISDFIGAPKRLNFMGDFKTELHLRLIRIGNSIHSQLPQQPNQKRAKAETPNKLKISYEEE